MHDSFLARVGFVLGLLLSTALVDSAVGQIGPHGHRGWGAYPYGAINSRANTMSRIAADQRAQSQARAAKQSSAIQRGIRSTLGQQAQSRSQEIRNRQQGAKDWWFQHLQKQAAQRPRQVAYVPVPATSGSVAQAATLAKSSSSSSRAATDIIKWPKLLQDPLFAEQRARVEEPYRNRTPESGRPTVSDYEAMIDATSQMKKTLTQVADRITGADYLAMNKFLDTLKAEAEAWVKKKTAEPSATESAPK